MSCVGCGKGPVLPKKEAESRMNVCKKCPHFAEEFTMCKKCYCFLIIKTRWAVAKCPAGKW